MKRMISTKFRSPKQAKSDRRVRGLIAKELPELIARHQRGADEPHRLLIFESDNSGHPIVGHCFTDRYNNTFRCESFDSRCGYWMNPIHVLDDGTFYRICVSEGDFWKTFAPTEATMDAWIAGMA